MSIASDALAAGFSVLSATNGEPLVLTRFGGSTANITAVVNRNLEDLPQDFPDFNAKDMSEIEYVLTDLADPVPKSGDYFTDENSHKHRVVTFRPRGEYGVCRCEVSQ